MKKFRLTKSSVAIILLVLLLIIIIPNLPVVKWIAGNSSKTIKIDSVTEFNQTLKDDYDEITRIRVYSLRPGIHWKISVNDTSNLDEIFYDIATFVKTSDFYEEVKDDYMFDFLEIDFFHHLSKIRGYGASYERATNSLPQPDDYYIDDFNTWWITDENYELVGTYVYEETN